MLAMTGTGNIYLLIVLLAVFLLVWYVTGISPRQRHKRIKLDVRFMRKINEIEVRIDSVGKLPVDIMAPEIIFYRRSSSRSFAIKSPGRNIFPLSLFPLTDYEFKIDLDRFYFEDKSLHQFRKAKIVVRERNGRLLKVKRIWM